MTNKIRQKSKTKVLKSAAVIVLSAVLCAALVLNYAYERENSLVTSFSQLGTGGQDSNGGTGGQDSNGEGGDSNAGTGGQGNNSGTAGQSENGKSEYRGIWINYSEFAKLIGKNTLERFNESVSGLLEFLNQSGYNTVVLHVRSHCDAFYFSKIFPFSARVERPSYDPLKAFITVAHSKNIGVEAWINPYRVSGNSESLDALPENSPALTLGADCILKHNGLYLNPARAQVRRLIVDGVREITNSYDIDAIHFDDYFYPTARDDFDIQAYKEYTATAKNPLSLDDFRRTNVNALILAVRQALPKGVAFGISPAADIEKNYSALYADINAWLDAGYIDYITPQLYFGFEYPKEAFRFDTLCEKWHDFVKGRARLYAGLAGYKMGKADAGSNEWIENPDIISRQRQCLFECGFAGYCMYSLGSVYKL